MVYKYLHHFRIHACKCITLAIFIFMFSSTRTLSLSLFVLFICSCPVSISSTSYPNPAMHSSGFIKRMICIVLVSVWIESTLLWIHKSYVYILISNICVIYNAKDVIFVKRAHSTICEPVKFQFFCYYLSFLNGIKSTIATECYVMCERIWVRVFMTV